MNITSICDREERINLGKCLQLIGSESSNFLSSETYELLMWHFVLKTNVDMAGRVIGNTRGEGARIIFRHKETRGTKTSNSATKIHLIVFDCM
jgi:hypothetical protein